ncbi:MAG TPA: GPW/gp25 family protein [Micromonosporaceae bacterium]|jgi:hypothetical protein|nr:GPW/gp25 family protein [Micromonosporaceae bacterium]
MTTPQQAFRFLGAGFEGVGAGLAASATGAVAMVGGDDSIRQAIVLLLCTMPGERLMRPEYGSYLHRLVFAPNDQTTAGLAIHYVRSALTRWEPRVEIVALDAEADPDVPERLHISLQYRVRATLATEQLEFSIATGGAP